ncbi:MAG TPA: DNA polymerase I [Bacteroidales bacterium]|nr:DNA polymerase I [Bacteroidales bacterium]
MPSEKRLFLLDAYALIYRAYYAFIKQPRINSKGENTSAVFGFVNTLEDLIKRENPSHMAVCFDPPGPTFRHDAYEQYKAQREETPEVIRWSVPLIKELVTAYRIPLIEVAGFEADDVIGTMAKLGEEKGFKVYMMTPDKDCGQLVTAGTFLYKPKYGSAEFDVMGPEEVTMRYGIEHPKQMIDLLGLMGDSSDNIPGCPGVGEVTAKKLLTEYGSIDHLLANLNTLKGKLKEKIEANIDLIKFSRFLATIRTDVPLTFDETALLREQPDMDLLQPLFERLEFRTLLNRVGKTLPIDGPVGQNRLSVTPIEAKTVQKTSTPPLTWDEPNLFNQGEPSLFNQGAVTPVKQEEGLFSAVEAGKNEGKGAEETIQTNLKDLNSVPHSYYFVDNESLFEQFLTVFSSQKIYCLDTETTHVDPMWAELVGMSFSWQPGEAWYLPFDSDKTKTAERLARLKHHLEKKDALLIGQNIKYDLMVLKQYGIEPQATLFDTMIAHYLLQPEQRHGMDYLAEAYLGYKPIPIESLIGPKGKNQLTMRDVPQASIAPYAAEDADITYQLWQVFEPLIKQNGLETLCCEVEMPLVKVLADMEYQGVTLDTVSLGRSSEIMAAELAALEARIQEEAGVNFNVNSPKQIGEVLFEKLNLNAKAKKTKTGQYATSEDTLESLRGKHPIVGLILEQRGLKKLLSTYIDALPALINPKTGKIHTSFNQAVTATGRLSSSNPNLQNIPIRDATGREIRKAFSCGPDEYFVSADYSQIELRIMAHLSGDKAMIKAFNSDQDIHAATAANIYHIPLEEVTSDMRRKAKTANFGIIYGISVFGLAERMGVSRTEAKTLIDGYFETYPAVKAYMDRVINEAKENGWVETLYHRKRYLPDITSNNAVVRGYAERNAINAPIQGTAADIIKIAMVRIQAALQREKLRSNMILQVHDELNFIVPKDELEPLMTLVRREMEAAAALHVPLKADIGYGSNWLEAH